MIEISSDSQLFNNGNRKRL